MGQRIPGVSDATLGHYFNIYVSGTPEWVRQATTEYLREQGCPEEEIKALFVWEDAQRSPEEAKRIADGRLPMSRAR